MNHPVTPILQMSLDDGLETNVSNRQDDQSIIGMLNDWALLAAGVSIGDSNKLNN